MNFRLVPKLVTLNDLERRNGRYISLFRCRKRCVAEFMQESIVFLVRVQCRRKESSRSLSHLLMSFLFLRPNNSNLTKLQLLITSVAHRISRL